MTGILQPRRKRQVEVVDGATYARIRREVIATTPAKGYNSESQARRIYRRVEQRLRSEGLYQLVTWSAAADRREENQALSELTVNRKTR